MVDGLISLQTVDGDGPRYGGAFHGRDFKNDAPRPGDPAPARTAPPDRMHAYAAMAHALLDAGLVHRAAEDAGRAPSIDLAMLKAITERRDVSDRIGSLIRAYLGSLAEIPASVLPDPARQHGAFEVMRWCLEIGRMPVGGSGPACR